MRLLLLLLLGCGQGPPAAKGEARAYVDAAILGDPAACARLTDPDLAGECRVFAAAAVAVELPASPSLAELAPAAALCTGAAPGVWQDECWFHLADTVEASGDLAKDLCGAAGRFRDPCFGHAVSRDSRLILASMPPGEELAALERLTAAASAYLGNQRGSARARQNLIKALAARFVDGPFEPEGCGQVPEELCVAVYRELVSLQTAQNRGPGKGSGDGGMRAVCDQGVELDRVVAFGLPAWTPAGEATARQAWQEICDQHHSAGGKAGRRGGPAGGAPPPVGR